MTNATGGIVGGSSARYDPFDNYRTWPGSNPGTTNHGFTGHRHNNTRTKAITGEQMIAEGLATLAATQGALDAGEELER